MYTSGCPKAQKKCCHTRGFAPAVTSKKVVPKSRSNISSVRATVSTGKASTSRKETISVIHAKTGSFIMLMPGARMLTMVTMKLNAAAREETPNTCNPSIQ